MFRSFNNDERSTKCQLCKVSRTCILTNMRNATYKGWEGQTSKVPTTVALLLISYSVVCVQMWRQSVYRIISKHSVQAYSYT